jgi:hypothetical protein
VRISHRTSTAKTCFAIKAPCVSIAGCQTSSRKSFLMFAEIVNHITLTVQRDFAPWKRARDTALARARMNRVRMKSSLQHN